MLLGDSLGASVVEAFAAWDFDGVAGYRSIAGLAMLDGVAGERAPPRRSTSRRASRAPGGFGSTSLARLRTSRRGRASSRCPLLGVQALVVSEIVGARRAAMAPDAVVADPDRDAL